LALVCKLFNSVNRLFLQLLLSPKLRTALPLDFIRSYIGLAALLVQGWLLIEVSSGVLDVTESEEGAVVSCQLLLLMASLSHRRDLTGEQGALIGFGIFVFPRP